MTQQENESHGPANSAQMPSDEELARKLMLDGHALMWDTFSEPGKTRFIEDVRTVREAVEQHWRAEVERLTNENAACEDMLIVMRNEHDDFEASITALEDERDSLKADYEFLSKQFEPFATNLQKAASRLAKAETEIERLKECLNSEYESNQIRNQHDLEVKEELQTALGEKFDPSVMTFRLVRDLARERDGYRIRLTETVDKYDHFIAERDSLREKLAAAEKGMEELRMANSDLARAAIANPTTTRPVTPRFTVTADAVLKIPNGPVLDDVYVSQPLLDYLTAHAVIDVPEGVPSAEDIREAWRKYNYQYHAGKNDSRLESPEFIHAYLAPYLQPAASVSLPKVISYDNDDLGRMVRHAWVEWAKEQPNPKPSWLVPYDELSEPDKEADRRIGEHLWLELQKALPAASVDTKLCEEDLVISYGDNVSVRFHGNGNGFYITITHNDNLASGNVGAISPADAHRAGMWLLSFAASQSEDVRLPVRQTIDDHSSMKAVMDLLARIHGDGGHYLAEHGLKKAATDAEQKVVALMQPIAPAETLEQLAEIAARAYWMEGFDACYDDEVKQRFIRAVTAILRAARPEVDVGAGKLQAKWEDLLDRSSSKEQDYADLCAWLNSRIRYRVEVPPAECDTRQQCESARKIVGRLSDSLMTTRDITSRKRAKWAGLIAELDAALGKDGE